MRTTIDIPERDHALFVSLARSMRISLSKLVVDLAQRGLKASVGVHDDPADYEINPLTGLAVIRSTRPITIDDVKALEDEEDDAIAGR